MADHHAELSIHTPVDEEAKTLIAKPLKPIGLVARTYRRVVLCGAAHGVGSCNECKSHEQNSAEPTPHEVIGSGRVSLLHESAPH